MRFSDPGYSVLPYSFFVVVVVVDSITAGLAGDCIATLAAASVHCCRDRSALGIPNACASRATPGWLRFRRCSSVGCLRKRTKEFCEGYVKKFDFCLLCQVWYTY